MDHDTFSILTLEIVDKREVDHKSPNMEVLGAERALRFLEGQGIKIVEFVTDAHSQIAKLIRK